jgi:hypothetical protein
MCFKRTSDYKVSPGITCFKAMHYKKGRLSPEFYNEKTYKLGDTIEAARLPHVNIPVKYWFKKKDFRKKIKKELVAKRIDNEHRSELGREAVHSFFSKRRAELWSQGEYLVIVECLIPEGEIYWENLYASQYASLSVKLIRIL